MRIRCTSKLIKEIGLIKGKLIENCPTESTLVEWYAHLFFLARRKCIIFTHVKTYYSFVVYDSNRDVIRRLDKAFRINLSRRLYEDGFSPEAIKKAIATSDIVTYGRATDRHVLSTMCQMIYEFGACLDRYGFVTPETRKKAADLLPRTPHKQGGDWCDYIIPLEEMWPLLEEKYPVSKTQAKEIAEKYSSQKKRRIFAVTGKMPERLQLSPLPSEPCWYVFYQWVDDKQRSMGKTMCVSRATGAVLYDEDSSAGPPLLKT